jgi:hypothetical protein
VDPDVTTFNLRRWTNCSTACVRHEMMASEMGSMAKGVWQLVGFAQWQEQDDSSRSL